MGSLAVDHYKLRLDLSIELDKNSIHSDEEWGA